MFTPKSMGIELIQLGKCGLGISRINPYALRPDPPWHWGKKRQAPAAAAAAQQVFQPHCWIICLQ